MGHLKQQLMFEELGRYFHSYTLKELYESSHSRDFIVGNKKRSKDKKGLLSQSIIILSPYMHTIPH